MTIGELEQLQASGEFHHATYRNLGTLWEGLWIYRKSDIGFRGYDVAGSFPAKSLELEAAERMCSGISLGAYGQG